MPVAITSPSLRHASAAAAMTVSANGVMRVKRKYFFFERKKQETFANWLIEQKFFGSFFQKRTACFLALESFQ
jgi:hypothetical protein